MRSVDKNPHTTVFRPHASDVERSAVRSDVPDISIATDVVRASLGDDILIDVSSSNAVNVPMPLEVVAALNVHPTVANTPTQADVIVLLTHSSTHNRTYLGEWGQAKVVDGTTSELVVMMRDISADALPNLPDDVLEECFNPDLEVRCALEGTDDFNRRAMLITSHLMTDPYDCTRNSS